LNLLEEMSFHVKSVNVRDTQRQLTCIISSQKSPHERKAPKFLVDDKVTQNHQKNSE